MSEEKDLSKKNLHLKITTHQKVVFDADVDEIYSKGTDGEFGILSNHIPFMSALDIGVTKAVTGGITEYFAIMGGVFQITDNQALILAQAAENGKDIDTARAKQAQERAEARLADSTEELDIKRAEIALARATARLKASLYK